MKTHNIRSSFTLFLFCAMTLPLSAETVINHNYLLDRGERTVGSMNKCIKEGEAPLYTDGACPTGYGLEDRQWQSEANFSYTEDSSTRAAREKEEQRYDDAAAEERRLAEIAERKRQEAAAGKEVKEEDLKKDLMGIGSIVTLMGADQETMESDEMDTLFHQTAKQFLPDDVDISNIKFKDAFEYGIKTLFNPDAIIDEALGEEK